ncbi:hypothetical protein LTS10_010787 [Elasticomyces elasticus]|nr:hypothetical protein LTS10_010787 [Elasticomyces elasticus]
MATSGVVAVPNAQGQSACRLFALPPELRNSIYELTFELPTDKIKLLRASRPAGKPLLLTCRLMYNEVRGLWRTFYRRYLLETKFTLHRRAKSLRMRDFMERDLARVRHITLVVSEVANNGFLDPGPLIQLANRVGRLEFSSGPNGSLANYEREPGGDWRCTSFRGVDLPEDVLAPRKNFSWQIGDRKTLVGDIDSSDTFVHITRTELCGMLGHALWLREWKSTTNKRDMDSLKNHGDSGDRAIKMALCAIARPSNTQAPINGNSALKEEFNITRTEASTFDCSRSYTHAEY